MNRPTTQKKTSPDTPEVFRKKILDWYDRHQRSLPWRALSRQTPNPYHVWLSEIMLQQTTVQAVIPYFLKFIEVWPTIHDLVNAENDDVMAAWAGLGYYARARNLHKCAKIVSQEFGGVFPDDQEELKKLPGVGDYTSAAIASIAFNKPAVVVDGNIERVMARYTKIETPLPEAKKEMKQAAAYFAEGYEDRPGCYAQALMDLGATICTPKSPLCGLCPINENCQAYYFDDPVRFPIRAPKKEKPKRYGYVYWIENERGEILLQKRPEKGLLGGMLGLPTTEWGDQQELEHLSFVNGAEELSEQVKHVFTHFELTLRPFIIKNYSEDVGNDYTIVSIRGFDPSSLPTVFKKAFHIFRAK